MRIQVLGEEALADPVRVALSDRQAEYVARPMADSDTQADVMIYARPLDTDGYQLLRQARERNPRLRTIIVTAAPVLPEAVYVLRGGPTSLAYDYLDVRDQSFAERLTAVVDEVNVLTYGDLSVRLDEKLAFYKGQPLGMTPTEADILAVMMRNPKGADYLQIADAVYGERLSVDEARRRLKTHIWEVRKKLRAVYGRDVAINREQVGYVLAI